MKLLTFQATHFRYRTFQKSLATVPDQEVDEAVENAVVAFMHVETADQDDDRRRRVFSHTLRHIKWIANKRSLRRVVLHSFSHLGAESAEPDFAQTLMTELAERLEKTGYEVRITPFGYFCSWDIGVFGDSLAKVFKQI